MDIILLNHSAEPIYQQIRNQIVDQILNGLLEEGEQLPSIRGLAKELKISVITTKRAYEELENEGYIDTVPGKGTFVSHLDRSALREQQKEMIKKKLRKKIEESKKAGFTLEEILSLIREWYGGK
ncbi:MAG: GntR family transcriptional regulator [Sporolactobacillus sp.]